MSARRFRVTGRVQGVGFRAFVMARARELALDGWVRNDPDGAVTVLAAGAPAALERLAAELAQGPPAARVAAVEAAGGEAPDGPGFRIARGDGPWTI
jgi:acylphosphatase